MNRIGMPFLFGVVMLESFFAEHPKAAVAFSGGTDSAYLLYAAKSFGADVKAYYVRSPFQPLFEYEDAKRFASEYGIDMTVIEKDTLKSSVVRSNPKDRCYHCKNLIFSSILEKAKEDGYTLILDGTNASDDEGDRPGMRALREMKVMSPLRDAGITKDMVRKLSKEAGLFTWDKPSYACLATRIETGEEITYDKLRAVEESESFLMGLGFRDFRVRKRGNDAKFEMKKEQYDLYIKNKELIDKKLKEYYDNVIPDTEARK